MKKQILILLLGLINFSLIAQIEKKVDSKIDNVVVYQEGAQITRQSMINLKIGKTTLVFTGLSPKIDSKSIQAKGNNELMIVSVSHSIDYLNKTSISDDIKQLEDRRLNIRDSLSLIIGLKKVYKQEKGMILANKEIGGDNGVDIAELESGATFFRNRLIEIEKKCNELDKDKYFLNIEFINISKQLLELNSKSNLPTSKVKVIVSAKVQSKYKIDLKYIVNEAGWIPNYDIRIDEVNQPMNLFYKAKVFQNSGENWNNVNLVLSTGNPSVSNYKPELSTYYLTFNNYYNQNRPKNRQQTVIFKGSVYGKVIDAETKEPLIGATIVVKGTTQGVVADIDGNYQLDIPWDKNVLQFSYIGYETHEQYINSGLVNVSLVQSLESLDEVVVTAYGISRTLQGRTPGVNISKKKEHIPLSIQKRQTSTEFKIKIPYSIPSDNNQYDVTMIEYEINADYHYSSVPKLSDDVFLTARIPEWTQYNMISGNANLFLKGVYQGETYLDLKSFEDTLSVSIGRDEDIVVSREIQRDFSSKSIIGSSKKEMKSWEITIKNNKNNNVNLVIEDQFPISKTTDIKVEQIEFSGAEINKDNGLLKWNLTLEPKENKTLVIKYSVKYPKNRNLIIE